jgi:hypothetical protein
VILMTPSAALADDDDLEFWLNPAVTFDLDDDTGLEFETAQRFRDADRGRVDTYYARLWVNQEVSDTFTLSGGVERRINDGGADETRLLQQVSGRHGLFRTRVRLEQRFVDEADRMGLRLRTRAGVSVPLGEDSPVSFDTNAELFWTLRSNNRGGNQGLTGLRAQIGFGYDVNDRLSVSLAYLRQEDFSDDKPDTVGHAPLIGIEYGF